MRADLLATLTVAQFFTDIGRSLREAFYMFWDTLWALVLGFALSGAIQAFASREQMQRRLGDHRPAAVTRASLYGMVSSSCSYAASAMARSLFARGADFVAAMVFMFASTNLVIELGIVLVVLIGWQFLAAELVGGVIMIALLVALGGLWLRGRALADARARVEDDHDAHHDEGISGGDSTGRSWRDRARSRAGWADAAAYTMSDLTMLRKEMVIGFGVAGFLATLVPVQVWNGVFLHGHGTWTTIENAVVGPFVAIISFVCSIGNVPLAAALWKGGISFGGVISFIFADLITLPLLLIYRKQYGRRMTIRMLALFWAVMSAAGLATEYLFGALGWIPTSRPTVVAADSLRLNYTTVLNVVALVAFALLYWLYRSRERLGGGSGYAKDPVCGMQVETRHAPAVLDYHGTRIYFCSEHCQQRFIAKPERYLLATPTDDEMAPAGAVDPICGMTVDPERAAAHRRSMGQDYYFCSVGCAEEFDRRKTEEMLAGSSTPVAFHRQPHT
ncbi:MAG TPA: permease [Acidimicrobiales bacterium]|nr:permease [Acidimicrobiales bacterium]